MPTPPSDAAAGAAEPDDAGGVQAAAIADDRARIAPGDRVALIVDHDREAARRALVQARARGFHAVVAARGDAGVTLAHELAPDLILLAAPVRGGAGVLDRLKRHPRTRHIPVYVCGRAEERIAALRAGAAGFLEAPVEADALARCYGAAQELLGDTRRLLVVEDDDVERASIVELVGPATTSRSPPSAPARRRWRRSPRSASTASCSTSSCPARRASRCSSTSRATSAIATCR